MCLRASACAARCAPKKSVGAREGNSQLTFRVARGMLDIARAVVLLYALVQAIRRRFATGVVFGALAALGLAFVGVSACLALSRHEVNGEYAFAFVYVGPTTLPLGGREWMPLVVEVALAAITAVPALVALRAPSSPSTGPSLLVFVPNAILAVLASFAGVMMWRQEQVLPGYFDNPSLASGVDTRSYERITLRPGADERAVVSARSSKPVRLLVRNFTGKPVDLVSLDADGRRSFRMDWVAGPGLVLAVSSFAGSAFVVTDEDAKAMCTFVVGDNDAVADVDGVCR